MHTSDWKITNDLLPGYDPIRDVATPSPDGHYLAVIFNCDEVGVSRFAGLLALLKGPPEKPEIIHRPKEFYCENAGPIQWFKGDRYCIVLPSPHLTKNILTNKFFRGFVCFDLEKKQFAVIKEIIKEDDEELHSQLEKSSWRPWSRLRYWMIMKCFI